MVLRYAHLAEHAKQIDAVFNGCVPNTPHGASISSAANLLKNLVGCGGLEPPT